ncbi:hypothetical protein B0H13DRAFT_2653274 [Mycena leptocephala]|nr:hypothetical protein B0H13DRAFT_2653274 [Mycena leptocephala]
MFLLAYLSVLGVVALGPQVVLASFKFSLSPVIQCEPVQITFSGGDSNNHSVPTTLTIIPLVDNAPPIPIKIPNAAPNSTGIQVSFIPLAAGIRFIASLDDIMGPTAKVSDVTGVSNSTSAQADSSCFGAGIPQVNFYEFDDVLNQCETFTITYNTTLAPRVRAFTPRGGSFFVHQNNDTTLPLGTASYTMNGQRDDEVVLLFDDGQTHQQVTELITIGGDSTSSKSCLKSSQGNNNKGLKTSSSSGLPKSTIIGIAIGAAVVGLLAIALLIWILRARRRNRRDMDMDFDPALLNRKWPPEEKKIQFSQTPAIAAPLSPFSPGGFVLDPIYTNEKYNSSIISGDARTSISSWNQFIPEDQRIHGSPLARRQSISSSRLSMNTADIHDILQMATVHQGHSGSGSPSYRPLPTPRPSTAGTTMTTFDVAKPAMARLVSTRRSGRSSDAPDLPTAVSRNNSASAAAIAGVPAGYGPASYTSFGENLTDEDGSRTPTQSDGGIGGYPVPTFRQTSPRDTSESWGNVVIG